MESFKGIGLPLLAIILMLLGFNILKQEAETGGGAVKLAVEDTRLINVEYYRDFRTQKREVKKGEIVIDISINNTGDAPLELSQITGQFYVGPNKSFSSLSKHKDPIEYAMRNLDPEEQREVTFTSDETLGFFGRAKRVLRVRVYDSNGKSIALKKFTLPKN